MFMRLSSVVKLGFHLSSIVVFNNRVFAPINSAHSLYAGHEGSILINSSPGFNREVIALNTANLPPGVTKTCSGLILENFLDIYRRSCGIPGISV